MRVTPYVKAQLERRRYTRKVFKWAEEGGWKRDGMYEYIMRASMDGQPHKIEVLSNFYYIWWRPADAPIQQAL